MRRLLQHDIRCSHWTELPGVEAFGLEWRQYSVEPLVVSHVRSRFAQEVGCEHQKQ